MERVQFLRFSLGRAKRRSLKRRVLLLGEETKRGGSNFQIPEENSFVKRGLLPF